MRFTSTRARKFLQKRDFRRGLASPLKTSVNLRGTCEGKDIDEFESVVKLTLQSIRDQLQNMTERLFHQERATNDLKQTLTELKDDSSTSRGKKGKRSS